MNTLAALRKSKGINQSEVAEYIGVSISAYSQYENSQRNIPEDKAKKIAEFFGVEISEIFLPSSFTVSKPNSIGQ